MDKKAQVSGLALTIVGLLIAGFLLIFGLIILSGLYTTIDFENGSGSQTVLADNGTLTTLSQVPTSLSANRLNQTWLDFDGVDDYVNYSNNNGLAINESMTIISWGNSQDLSASSNKDLITKGTTNSFEFSLSVRNTNNTQFVIFNDAGSNYFTASGSINILENQWYMFTGLTNKTDAQVYTNGLSDGTDSSSSGTRETDGIAEIHIGDRQTQGGDKRWNGSIENIRIYNKSLDPKQIRRIYNESILGSNLGKSIPVLSYHQIENPGIATTHVNLTNFEEQMNWLNSSGYTTITYDDWLDWRNGNSLLEEKPIILVFDDGFLNIFNGSNIMDNYGYIGVLGVITNSVEDANRLSWENITTLKNKGWQIASHSINASIVNDTNEIMIEYFNGSKTSVIGNLSITPSIFIYPSNFNNVTADDLCSTFYTMCSGFSTSTNTQEAFLFKEANLTHEEGNPIGFRRVIIANDTTINQMINAIDYHEGLLIHSKLNENSGTTAHDTSGNSNDGTITGATWNNDGVLITLTNLVDYTLSGAIFTIINTNYAWSEIQTTFNYDISGIVKSSANNTLVGLGTFADFWEIIILAIITGIVIGLLLVVFSVRSQR